jgi:hypothetical protein
LCNAGVTFKSVAAPEGLDGELEDVIEIGFSMGSTEIAVVSESANVIFGRFAVSFND